MRYSLINSNQIHYKCIYFWDSSIGTSHVLFIDVDVDTTMLLTFEGNKLILNTRVPTNIELAECHHIKMSASMPRNLNEIHIGVIYRSDRNKKPFMRYIGMTLTSTSPYLGYNTENVYGYIEYKSNETALHSIYPILVSLKDLSIEGLI